MAQFTHDTKKKNVKLGVIEKKCYLEGEREQMYNEKKIRGEKKSGVKTTRSVKNCLSSLHLRFSGAIVTNLENITLTFFLFSSFSLVTYFYSTNRQNDSDYKEQYSANDASRNCFVLDPSWHREFDLLAGFVTLERVGQYPEIVCAAANEILHQVRCILRSDLATVQCLPLCIGAIFYRVELDQMGTFQWRLPSYEKPIGNFRHRQIPRYTRFWT